MIESIISEFRGFCFNSHQLSFASCSHWYEPGASYLGNKIGLSVSELMNFGICHSKCQRTRIEHIGLDLVTRPKGVRKSCLCVHLRMAHNILVILMRVLHACLKYLFSG